MKCYGVIYKIRNKINNKIYFGQTTNKHGFYGRYQCVEDMNKLADNTHNEHLRRSIRKYGLENFEIDVQFDHADSQEELNKLEHMYISIYNTINPMCGYNKTTGGNVARPNEETKKKISQSLKGKMVGEKNPMYGRKHTEETKQKIRENRADLSGEKNGMYGKRHTEETREKMREQALKSSHNKKENNPMWGKDHTPEAKAKISEANKGKTIQQNHLDVLRKQTGSKNPNSKGKIIGKSVNEAKVLVLECAKSAKKLGFDDSSICKCLKNKYGKKKNVYKEYEWYYLK